MYLTLLYCHIHRLGKANEDDDHKRFAGEYKCIATNEYSTAEATAILSLLM